MRLSPHLSLKVVVVYRADSELRLCAMILNGKEVKPSWETQG